MRALLYVVLVVRTVEIVIFFRVNANETGDCLFFLSLFVEEYFLVFFLPFTPIIGRFIFGLGVIPVSSPVRFIATWNFNNLFARDKKKAAQRVKRFALRISERENSARDFCFLRGKDLKRKEKN